FARLNQGCEFKRIVELVAAKNLDWDIDFGVCSRFELLRFERKRRDLGAADGEEEFRAEAPLNGSVVVVGNLPEESAVAGSPGVGHNVHRTGPRGSVFGRSQH